MIDPLFKQPQNFDFFQAVRLLERAGAQREPRRQPVGFDAPPAEEAVRFQALPALSFAGAAIASLRPGQLESGRQLPAEMVVAFMGLIGPLSALPEHYTTMVLARLRERDPAMRRFFDAFNHRVISLFYRAWQKYHLPAAYERSEAVGGIDDIRQLLYGLSGFGTDHLRGRMDADDRAVLFYSGHFSQQRRPASCLEGMLCEYFGLPLRVEPFCGQWLLLEAANRSCLGTRQEPRGLNAELGRSVILGERVWDVQSKFRLHIGPLRYEQFARLMPDGGSLRPLIDLTRSYVGAEYDFDVRLELRHDEVPECRLGDAGAASPRLGWNTWLHSRPISRDVADATFSVS